MEDTPSSIPNQIRGNTNTINISNNMTNDNATKIKSTDNLNIKFNNTNDMELMKLNDNCNFLSIKLHKDSFEEEEFKDLQEIKKNFKTLVKLNVIEESLYRNIMHYLVEIINNKYNLPSGLITELIKKLKLATSISQKHFKHGKEYFK